MIRPFIGCCKKWDDKFKTGNRCGDIYQCMHIHQLEAEKYEIEGQIDLYSKLYANRAKIVKNISKEFLPNEQLNTFIEDCCRPKLLAVKEQIKQIYKEECESHTLHKTKE